MGYRPWWLTLAGKLVLSRLPLNYGFWAKVGLFRHGGMDDPQYAISVFNTHVGAAGLQDQLSGKVILELGPGDSVGTAVIAAGAGASAILVDAGDFAAKDLERYQALAHLVGSERQVSLSTGFTDMLKRCNDSRYLTAGLASLRSLPSASVDFLFSNAVLEHVARDEFASMVAELKRVMKPGACMSHEIDLRDHLGGGKNNMRFSEGLWESSFFKGGGFYTNRLTRSEIRNFFVENGFEVSQEEAIAHEPKPSRRILNRAFAKIDDLDFNTAIVKFVFKT